MDKTKFASNIWINRIRCIVSSSKLRINPNWSLHIDPYTYMLYPQHLDERMQTELVGVGYMSLWMGNDKKTPWAARFFLPYQVEVRAASESHLGTKLNVASSMAWEFSTDQMWDPSCVKSQITDLHSDARPLSSVFPTSRVLEPPSLKLNLHLMENWLIDHINGRSWWIQLTLPIPTVVLGWWFGLLCGSGSMAMFGLSGAVFRSLTGSVLYVVLQWLIWERAHTSKDLKRKMKVLFAKGDLSNCF